MAMSTPLVEKQRQLALRQQLRMGLSTLPAPSNEYKLLMPEIEEEEGENDDDKIVEDSEDTLRRHQDAIKAQEALKLRLRSQVLKRSLPRPLGVNRGFVEPDEADAALPDEDLRQAAKEVRQEVLRMLVHEAMEYPIKGAEIPKTHGEYQQFPEEDLIAARKQLTEETAASNDAGPSAPPEVFAQLWDRVSSENLYVPSKKKVLPVSSLTVEEHVSALKAELDALQALAKKETTKAAKLEKRLSVYNGGYQSRASALQKAIMDLYMNLDKANVELCCFQELRSMEERAIPRRLSAIHEELTELRQREETLQRRYAELAALHREATTSS